MKKALFLLLPLISLTSLNAQYYYQDVIVTNEITQRMATLNREKVRSITATGYDQRGAKSSDFNEWQDVLENGRLLKVTSRNGTVVERHYYSFDEEGKLVSLRDSARGIETITKYSYASPGVLTNVSMKVNDSLQEFSKTEERRWIYDANGRLVSMLRIVNGTDSSTYNFKVDEAGNVIEEQLYRITQSAEPMYYYYDEDRRLTDVVRYHKILKRLLPDFMFEYDENDNVIQRISVVSATNSEYVTWRYIYDSRGLKTKDVLFDKEKRMSGRIDYAYSF